MKLSFFKYQGTGNDFVMVDNRRGMLSKNNTILFRQLCDRKFGIGADGLILLENSDEPAEDFKMLYFNSDGRESSMCGNGGRCIVAFAKHLGIITERAAFTAIDGFHEAVIEKGLVGLKMTNVSGIEEMKGSYFLNTGSPHHVLFTEQIETIDLQKEGAAIRYSERYKATGGANVNFVEPVDEATFKVRTYERGVEDETLSCGTGVTAVALASYSAGLTQANTVRLETQGGPLAVSFDPVDNAFQNIWLTGPAEFVFKGEIDVDIKR